MIKIDAHQHFWNYDPVEYTWIGPSMDVLKKDYLPSDLKPLLEQSGFGGCVAVQARQSEAETEFLLRLSEQNPFVKGVVGWLDLTSPEIAGRIDEFRQRKALKGIRHTIQSEPDGFMTAPDFMGGVKLLSTYGLTYDLLINEKQLEEAYRFVAALPEVAIVIDHIAKPDIKKQSYAHWSHWMSRISEYPNVYVKLSGLVTEADWRHWTRSDLEPYLDFCLERFQPDRLMIGSDWPVCLLASDHQEVISIVSEHINTLSVDEQDAILGGTAINFYKLNP